MEIELLTKDDIKELVVLITKSRNDLAEVKALLAEAENQLLDSKEIRKNIGNISLAVFNARRSELCTAGMFKDGQWKMYLKDIKRYIKSKRDN